MVTRNLHNVDLETLVSLSKRRGFVFQSSEIYGGVGSVWDYGAVGVELKRNVKDAGGGRWSAEREDIVGIDASILMHPEVWRASGHVDSFSDPLVECGDCHRRFRADDFESSACPECGGALTDPRQFNLMFETRMGPVRDESSVTYLRPETAPGHICQFFEYPDNDS